MSYEKYKNKTLNWEEVYVGAGKLKGVREDAWRWDRYDPSTGGPPGIHLSLMNYLLNAE